MAQPDLNKKNSSTKTTPQPHTDLLRSQLTTAPRDLDLGLWLPPQTGIVPRIRIFSRWVNILWALPVGFLALLVTVAIAQELRTFPAVQAFIQTYPGDVDLAVTSGFPLWLRLLHFFNLFLMFFIIRSGIQILADHPRVYWNRNCVPGSEWFRFQHEVPRDRLWTSKDDSVQVPRWLGLPGVRHTVGLARKWHFFVDLLWLTIGVIFYVLLFTSDQWKRLVPVSWDVFPQALSAALQYASLDFPPNHGWTRFNGLQQLTYFLTVFVMPFLALVSGLLQSPAISNKIGWVGRTFHRQVGRTIHFFVLCWFLLFIVCHVTMVFLTGLLVNLNHMFWGVDDAGIAGLLMFCAAMLLVAIAWFTASPVTIRHARWIQRVGEDAGGWLKGLGELWNPTNQFTEKDISPYFWANGTMPSSEEYDALAKRNFSDYSLRIDGLVEHPSVFSYDELKAFPRQEQITEHFCIQGWSGVAKWAGVPMRHILEKVKPRPEAQYVVFYSYADGAEGGRYYDVHRLENMRHTLTILAYEMNGSPLSVVHGAPLRLRVENELGFKMVKWIEFIELVEDFRHIGAGCGGYNEDHEFYGYREPI
ncbi:MAG: molybdopterin-dependent oxidoreductase [Bryobacterales bacterium]|nr:molybdopterin-dependent oxidoreductase [Bryobacterales bacterium]